jgi:hypothetical protein
LWKCFVKDWEEACFLGIRSWHVLEWFNAEGKSKWDENLYSTIKRINSMEYNYPSEAYSHTTIQDMFRFLCNPKVYYRVNKSSSQVSIRSSVHSCTLLNFKIHFNIILPRMW